MAKSKSKSRASSSVGKQSETDSYYLLKIIAYVVVGACWLRIDRGANEVPIPLGFILGLTISRHERLQIDRKIEYAILLMAMFLGYWFVPGVTLVW